MATHITTVTFEISSKTGKVYILRSQRRSIKGQPGQWREIPQRKPLSFLMPKNRTPQENVDTLHHILENLLGNPQ